MLLHINRTEEWQTWKSDELKKKHVSSRDSFDISFNRHSMHIPAVASDLKVKLIQC